ncbi:MAG: transposase [Desulfobacterales bacterium]|nr:transposase [Desulfobacterales bacterium]
MWHITHRCHKKEFLLKFARDRRRYLQWFFEAKKRFGLSVLNYMVTSNHVHLLVRDSGERDGIPNSIRLIAGRTGQEFNQRKKRKGAYWEDRYHATAVETDSHLIQCLLYIDLNMVRAGAVRHPSEWPFSGYNEIQETPGAICIGRLRGVREPTEVQGNARSC